MLEIVHARISDGIQHAVPGTGVRDVVDSSHSVADRNRHKELATKRL